MKKIMSIVSILVFTAVGIFAQDKAKISEKDEKAIRANVEQMVKGWNLKSGAEFAQPFAEDSDYVVINGMHVKGRAANAAGHQQIFDTVYKNTSLTLVLEQIRFLRPDVAVAHVLAETKTPQGDSTRKTNARITMVMTRNKDKWEIAAFQNTQIQMPAEK